MPRQSYTRFPPISGILRWVILANPMTPVVEVFRLAFLGVSAINPFYLLYSLAFAVVIFYRIAALQSC